MIDIKKRLLYRVNGLKICLVDGKSVKPQFDMDFVEGGHGYIYDYIPKDEVWIDDAVDGDERNFVIFHEIYERQLMKEGMKYKEAHDKANDAEKGCRMGQIRISDKPPKRYRHPAIKNRSARIIPPFVRELRRHEQIPGRVVIDMKGRKHRQKRGSVL